MFSFKGDSKCVSSDQKLCDITTIKSCTDIEYQIQIDNLKRNIKKKDATISKLQNQIKIRNQELRQKIYKLEDFQACASIYKLKLAQEIEWSSIIQRKYLQISKKISILSKIITNFDKNTNFSQNQNWLACCQNQIQNGLNKQQPWCNATENLQRFTNIMRKLQNMLQNVSEKNQKEKKASQTKDQQILKLKQRLKRYQYLKSASIKDIGSEEQNLQSLKEESQENNQEHENKSIDTIKKVARSRFFLDPQNSGQKMDNTLILKRQNSGKQKKYSLDITQRDKK